MLVLFDIDGTLLIKASIEHAKAMLAAIGEVWGIEPGNGLQLDAAGRTDIDIARQICLRCGVTPEAFDAGRADIIEASVRHYRAWVPADMSERQAPGAKAALDALAAEPQWRLSLVTGNLEAVGHLKLGSAGLGHYFTRGQGGFGSDSEHRADLPPLARARAGELWNGGRPWAQDQTVVVGDTPRDIACARADEVRVFAVTTGPYAAADLVGADAVLDGLTAVPALLTRAR